MEGKYGFSPSSPLEAMSPTSAPAPTSPTVHLNYPPHQHNSHSHLHGHSHSRSTNMARSPLAHSPPLQVSHGSHCFGLNSKLIPCMLLIGTFILFQNSNGPPELPPRIDRNIKPPRVGLTRSATDRLYPSKEMEPTSNGTSNTNGSPPSPVDPPNYINATPHHLRTSGPNSSLDRHIMKTVCTHSCYDLIAMS